MLLAQSGIETLWGLNLHPGRSSMTAMTFTAGCPGDSYKRPTSSPASPVAAWCGWVLWLVSNLFQMLSLRTDLRLQTFVCEKQCICRQSERERERESESERENRQVLPHRNSQCFQCFGQTQLGMLSCVCVLSRCQSQRCCFYHRH